MLQVLVESGAVRERRASWTGISVVLHSVLIGLALYLTATVDRSPAPIEPIETIVYTAPTPASTPAAATPVASAVSFAISRLSVTVPQVAMPPVDVPASDVF